MTRTAAATLVAASFIAAASAAPAGQTQAGAPPRDSRPDAGTAVIAGTVAAGDSRQPLRRAQVILTGGSVRRLT